MIETVGRTMAQAHGRRTDRARKTRSHQLYMLVRFFVFVVFKEVGARNG